MLTDNCISRVSSEGSDRRGWDGAGQQGGAALRLEGLYSKPVAPVDRWLNLELKYRQGDRPFIARRKRQIINSRYKWNGLASGVCMHESTRIDKGNLVLNPSRDTRKKRQRHNAVVVGREEGGEEATTVDLIYFPTKREQDNKGEDNERAGKKKKNSRDKRASTIVHYPTV